MYVFQGVRGDKARKWPKSQVYNNKNVSSIERINISRNNQKWQIVNIDQTNFNLGSFQMASFSNLGLEENITDPKFVIFGGFENHETSNKLQTFNLNRKLEAFSDCDITLKHPDKFSR